jgi:hypothetical protein
MDQHRFDAYTNPDFHFDASPDPDPDGQQNDVDPKVDADPTLSLHTLEKKEKIYFY